jgi:hypothetical protein
MQCIVGAWEADNVSCPRRLSHKESAQVNQIIEQTRLLLDKIDKDIPLLQLAITASGESLSTSLPIGISPSRLLQASTLLTIGDTQHSQDPSQTVQIGPHFNLSIYMLFLAHAGPKEDASSLLLQRGQCSCTEANPERSREPVYGLGESERKPIWQEVIHKARVQLKRVPTRQSHELSQHEIRFAYHLEVVEDMDDGRVHGEVHASPPKEGKSSAGIEECIPICQISKLFYTDSGRLLNIGADIDGSKTPVLLIKRDVNTSVRNARPIKDVDDGFDSKAHEFVVEPPFSEVCDQKAIDLQLQNEILADHPYLAKSTGSERIKRFPAHLDPEWIAMEIFEEDLEIDELSESEAVDAAMGSAHSEAPQSPTDHHEDSPIDSKLAAKVENITLKEPERTESERGGPRKVMGASAGPTRHNRGTVESPFGAITTSLSLIEMLVRLAGLQEFQQASHLSIPDHILTFFLEETSTTGLVGEAQWKTREQTKRRVGFDPYTDAAVERASS